MARDLNSISQAFRPVGGGQAVATLALSVANTLHTGVQLPTPPGGSTATPDSAPTQFDVFNSHATSDIAIGFGATAAIAQANAVLPTDGVTGGYVVSHNSRVVLTIDGNPQFVAAIGSVVGPALLYVTPGNGR